jgi:hypothetical protein
MAILLAVQELSAGYVDCAKRIEVVQMRMLAAMAVRMPLARDDNSCKRTIASR